MKPLFFRLIICLITLSVLESCSIFGIEKIIIRQSEFTYTENDILFKAKLECVTTNNEENIIFPIYSKVPTPVSYNRPNERESLSFRISEYQPTILFLTKDRFVLNMGCTFYGQLSKGKENTFDIISVENSNDCYSKEFNKIETLVTNALKSSTKCKLENEVLTFTKDGYVLMVYNVI